jgi:hypothetical protein
MAGTKERRIRAKYTRSPRKLDRASKLLIFTAIVAGQKLVRISSVDPCQPTRLFQVREEQNHHVQPL